MIDLNEAERQTGETIPPGPYRVRARLRPRAAGPEGLLRASKSGATEMLELELTVVDK